MKQFLSYVKTVFYNFLKGVIFAGPVLLTVYIFIMLFNWVDSLIPLEKIIPEKITYIPGFGVLFIFVLFSFIGYLSKNFAFNRFFHFFTKQVIKVPFISFLFTSIKDLFDVFNKKDSKLNRPILFKTNPQDDVYQIGFLVQDNLEALEMDDFFCVYMPFSFGFMGKIIFIKKSQLIKSIPKNIHSSQMLKFVVSGGISGITETEEKNHPKEDTK